MADFSFGNDGETGGGGNEASGVGSAPAVEPGSNNVAGNEDNRVAGVIDGGAGKDTPDIGPVVTKKRGRKPLPRDAAGNVIRDAASAGAKAAGTGVQASAKLAVKNDRNVVLGQIQGMHGFVAILTKQPIFALSPDEAKAMTNALCDVADYHGISLTGAAGPWGLYITLGLTGYSIYAPRLKAIKSKPVDAAPAMQREAANPSQVRKPANGMMDFSGDTLN